MNAMRKLLAGATFLIGCVTLAPRPALAAEEERQTYECVTTTIRTTIVTTDAEGKITFRYYVSVETVCTPIESA